MQFPVIPIEHDDIENGAYGIADQWIRNWIIDSELDNQSSTFPMALWNVCTKVEQNQCRTNNSLEGWHRSFASLFSGHHPKLKALS
jgi:hypothetical protein